MRSCNARSHRTAHSHTTPCTLAGCGDAQCVHQPCNNVAKHFLCRNWISIFETPGSNTPRSRSTFSAGIDLSADREDADAVVRVVVLAFVAAAPVEAVAAAAFLARDDASDGLENAVNNDDARDPAPPAPAPAHVRACIEVMDEAAAVAAVAAGAARGSTMCGGCCDNSVCETCDCGRSEADICVSCGSVSGSSSGMLVF